jgi:hypothetical protein
MFTEKVQGHVIDPRLAFTVTEVIFMILIIVTRLQSGDCGHKEYC